MFPVCAVPPMLDRTGKESPVFAIQCRKTGLIFVHDDETIAETRKRLVMISGME
jgi:hypothetical protein